MHLSQVIKQKPHEHVKTVLRRHWFTFLPETGMFMLLLLVPAALYFMISSIFPGLFENDYIFAPAVLLGSLFYLSIFILYYTQFVEFYLDQWIITNDRIVDIEQLSLFSRTISELELFRIQDVTTEVHGVFPTMLHYGTVHVATASNNVNIIFHDVPRPDHIRQMLLDLAEQDRKKHVGES